MAVIQRLGIDAQGDYVCAGCGEPVRQVEGDDPGLPGIGIVHKDGCTEVARIRAGAA